MPKSKQLNFLAEDVVSKDWTFFTNHAHVLITIACAPTASLRQISQAVGITERGVQKIISDLADGGYLTRAKVGRRNQYRLSLSQPLRHPIEQHRSIGDVVNLLYPQTGVRTTVQKRK